MRAAPSRSYSLRPPLRPQLRLPRPPDPFQPPPEDTQIRASARDIMREECVAYDVSLEAVRGQRRDRPIVLVRHAIAYRLVTGTELSYPQIGTLLNRDHSTIIHAARAHAWRNGLPPPRNGSSVRRRRGGRAVIHTDAAAKVADLEAMVRTPVRIQRRRIRGWRMPEGAVYVGRGSMWGNVFVARGGGLAAESFRGWLAGDPRYRRGDGPDRERDLINGAIGELTGKVLACWCRLDRPCHGDVLLELANAPIGLTCAP